MKLKIQKKHLIILLYLLIFILYTFAKQSAIMYATCLITLFGLFSGLVNIEIAIIFSLMIGNELACYINLFICILYVFAKKKKAKLAYEKNVVIFVAALLLSSLINMLISGALFNTLFGIIYYLVLFMFSFSVKGYLDEEKTVEAVKIGVLSQIICGLLIVVKHKSIMPGDIHCGTFTDANYSVIFLLVSLCYLVKYYYSRGLRIKQLVRKEWLYIIGAVVFVILGSAKNVYVGFVLAVVVYAIAKKATKNKSQQIISSIIILYIALFGGIILIHSPIINSFVMQKAPQEIGIYLYDKSYSFKYSYFEGTIFEELAGPRILFGYGIGQYGSRIANMFGYESMYREDSAINRLIADNFEESILPNYRKYVSVYTKEIVDVIQWRSAILTYPFSSIIAFLAETGVIGLFFMSYIWGRAGNKSKYGFLVTFLFSICIFDIYFDHICVTALIVTLLLSDKNKGNLRDAI